MVGAVWDCSACLVCKNRGRIMGSFAGVPLVYCWRHSEVFDKFVKVRDGLKNHDTKGFHVGHFRRYRDAVKV